MGEFYFYLKYLTVEWLGPFTSIITLGLAGYGLHELTEWRRYLKQAKSYEILEGKMKKLDQAQHVIFQELSNYNNLVRLSNTVFRDNKKIFDIDPKNTLQLTNWEVRNNLLKVSYKNGTEEQYNYSENVHQSAHALQTVMHEIYCNYQSGHILKEVLKNEGKKLKFIAVTNRFLFFIYHIVYSEITNVTNVKNDSTDISVRANTWKDLDVFFETLDKIQ